MSNERIKRLVDNDEQFNLIKRFIDENYEETDQGILDIENLSNDKEKFNYFIKDLTLITNLKLLKEEYFPTINIEEIVDKLVLDIQNLPDDKETTIDNLIDREFNRYQNKYLYDIYHLLQKKLTDIGLYLDLGKGKNPGLPFYIPFKKGYILNIIIKKRKYIGIFDKGTIFSELIFLSLSGKTATNKYEIEYCFDENINDNAKLSSIIPCIYSEEDISKIYTIINNIKNKYNGKNKEKMNIKEYIQFTEVTINGIEYIVNNNDEDLLLLIKIMQSEKVNTKINKLINELVNNN